MIKNRKKETELSFNKFSIICDHVFIGDYLQDREALNTACLGPGQ